MARSRRRTLDAHRPIRKRRTPARGCAPQFGRRARLRGLSELEHAVARHIALGNSNKLIAYSLGLSEGTVAALVSRALRKLRLPARAALAHLFARTMDEAELSL